MSLRAYLSAACLAGLVIFSVRLPPLTLPFVDRERIHRAMTIMPDRGAWWPDYPRFLDAVRERTRNGDSIALYVPARSWEGGYSYAYYRASYYLAGREVLPLMNPASRRMPGNIDRATFIAIWPGNPPPGTKVVFAGYRGALVRR